jgi:aryl-alcohol dehydrogenase
MTDIIAAVTREAGKPFSLESLELAAPRDNEVLVKVAATGICHTDLIVRDGHLPTPLPVVLGHEGSGIVERVGHGVRGIAVGDAVVMSFNSCGTCASCADSEPAYCHEFFPRNFFASRADGTSALSQRGMPIHSNFFGQSSFATHAICHDRNIVKVPADLPLELLGPLGCGIATGAGAVMNALKIRPGSSLAVFGVGSVGLAAVLAAHAVGAAVIVAVDLNAGRLTLARSLGATQAIDGNAGGVHEAIMDLTKVGIDYALDTTGSAAVIREAVRSLAPRGSCGIVGASPMGAELGVDLVHFMSGGRRLMGIVEGSATPASFIPTLLAMYRAGSFPFDRLVSYYPFARINDAVEDSANGVAIKAVVRM